MKWKTRFDSIRLDSTLSLEGNRGKRTKRNEGRLFALSFLLACLPTLGTGMKGNEMKWTDFGKENEMKTNKK